MELSSPPRVCPCCKVEKNIEEFVRIRRGKVIDKKQCHGCRRKAAKEKRGTHGTDYQSRNLNLKKLGFGSYSEYLNSELWRGIRRNVYAVKGSRCVLCGDAADALHHNRYHANDLLGKRIKYINPVCEPCHTKIEFKNGLKTKLHESRSIFRKERIAFKRKD